MTLDPANGQSKIDVILHKANDSASAAAIALAEEKGALIVDPLDRYQECKSRCGLRPPVCIYPSFL